MYFGCLYKKSNNEILLWRKASVRGAIAALEHDCYRSLNGDVIPTGWGEVVRYPAELENMSTDWVKDHMVIKSIIGNTIEVDYVQ